MKKQKRATKKKLAERRRKTSRDKRKHEMSEMSKARAKHTPVRNLFPNNLIGVKVHVAAPPAVDEVKLAERFAEETPILHNGRWYRFSESVNSSPYGDGTRVDSLDLSKWATDRSSPSASLETKDLAPLEPPKSEAWKYRLIAAACILITMGIAIAVYYR